MNTVRSAVSAVIQDTSGRVLLCQQKQGRRLWALPGGPAQDREGPVSAVVRRVREETGLEIDISDIVGLYQLTGDGCGKGLPDLGVLVFRARLRDGEAGVNAPGRICRVAWCDPATLPQPLTATTRTAVADATSGRCGVLRHVQRDADPEASEVNDSVPDA